MVFIMSGYLSLAIIGNFLRGEMIAQRTVNGEQFDRLRIVIGNCGSRSKVCQAAANNKAFSVHGPPYFPVPEIKSIFLFNG